MKRVLIIGQNAVERALIAAQLQEETPCAVESAATIRDALARLVIRPALVILDWSALAEDAQTGFRAAARGAPMLLLASRDDGESLERAGVDLRCVIFRPFTVGDVVVRARELLEGASGIG
jgi:DNA-binding response OmpR family regulator